MARSIATNTVVDLSELLEFVRPRHRMLIASTRTHRPPHTPPVSGGASGERNPARQQWVGGKELTARGDPLEEYHLGDVVQFLTPDGQGRFAGVVLQVRDDAAVLFDFNHPLAGQPVTFEVHLLGVL